MNKSELIAALAEKTGLTKKAAGEYADAFTDTVTETLAAGESVALVGFGTFCVKNRPARIARNPRTGEELKVAASKSPAFKPGKGLKEAVK